MKIVEIIMGFILHKSLFVCRPEFLSSLFHNTNHNSLQCGAKRDGPAMER